MATESEEYKENDDLGLYLTLIQNVNMTFNPERELVFNIVKPLNFNDKPLKWNTGKLTFKNIHFCDLQFINEYNEYPEFYRSAILKESNLIKETVSKLNRLNKQINSPLIHYYLYTLQGDKEIEINILSESYELKLNSESKPLEDFKGFDN
ncbi:Hypothetical protein LBF_2151 [Leptospira biflexa serovar Patoc strain 'Patoc 1 (Ames)']|uniref:Uncharacterized protein n=1 Tax=Leptospira biflexa serovar Patoc (strain Patoc 1 / ATCC 23582 / Paris) TaxID=456481 RepID=B0ST71_LEPBP|nr:hypothetical protein [Leptospira biflexa]ABZ94648.1 Hypothetical protein LBF_2151 [Leptospira biflexa serovar Patoc strain 'Patoc 1 (Ames)']ABZ98311.1 Hypothetical protein LEPBI_I2213 [Leptospira biflexa serovar Patoc strain 'Patoc 1 (Paris)']